MPICPSSLWRNLPAEARRAIVDDLAAVLREMNHEIGAYQAEPSRKQSGGVFRQSPPQQVINNQESLRLQLHCANVLANSVGMRATSI
jgi:hypothetical protein